MNKVFLIGRLTADPELRYTQSNKAYTRFTIAVNRNFKNESGETDADFISAVAWDKRAETICNYVRKGHRIGIAGRIQTGSYEKEDGTRGYLTDVIVSELEFLENKSKDERPAPDYPEDDNPFDDGDYSTVTDDDLPF